MVRPDAHQAIPSDLKGHVPSSRSGENLFELPLG